MTGRTDPPDRLEEIARVYTQSGVVASDRQLHAHAVELARGYLRLVAELRAARELSNHWRDLAVEASKFAPIIVRQRAELAAAHQVIAESRRLLAAISLEHGNDLLKRGPLGDVAVHYNSQLAVFDANHPAQGEPH